MEFRALGDKVFVRRIHAEEVSKGGIIIPDNAQEKPVEGIVVASGPGRQLPNGRFVENTIKPGDRVIVPKWAGEFDIDGEKLVMVPEESILAVIEEDEG